MIIIENVFKYGSPIYAEVVYGTSSGGAGASTWGTITGTITNQTDLVSYVANRVPYTGATSDVNLGEFGLLTGNLEFDTTPTNAPITAGSAVWDDSVGTLNLVLKGGNVNAKLAQDSYARVVNKVGSNLTKANYRVLKVTNPQGQRLAVNLAQGNNDANSADTIGINAEDIANNQEGFIITFGEITGINTTGSLFGETWADGDVLYLSPTTAGYLTNIKPLGQHIVVLGYVEYSHANNGKIFVKVMNGWELEELHDVNITSPTNGQALTYNSATQKWVNTTLGGGSGTVTSVSVVTANGFAGSVANPTTTPAITLTTSITGLIKGNGTSLSAAVAGTDYQNPISLTTTGSSGAATFISNTLNVPNYTLSGLGGVPTSRTITIDGTSFDLSADRSWTIAAITSLNGLTASTQTFANDTNITITSATSTHTIGWSGQLSIARGGTGQSTATAAFDALNPMTTLGDMIYEGTGPTAVRLAGNTSTTKQYLSQTGTGTVSAAPAWSQIVLNDISTVSVSSPTTNQVLQYNGTNWVNATLSGSGITSLNGLTAGTQTFATGTSGTDFNISSTTSTHTFNIPDASNTAGSRGLIIQGSQTIGGNKIIQGSGATSTTSSLLVRNSSSTTIAQFRDDGFIQVNSIISSINNRMILTGATNTAGSNPGITLDRPSGQMAAGETMVGIPVGVTATSGTTDITILRSTGTLNTTSTNTSVIRSIYIAHTFTSITGSYRGIDILAPATVTGGGTITYLQCRTASADIFVVQPTTITLGDSVNFAFNTTTGTKFGTSTSQKIGFYNATPIVQPTTATAAATFVANTGTAVNDASTFDGYTLGSAIKALRNLGILA